MKRVQSFDLLDMEAELAARKRRDEAIARSHRRQSAGGFGFGHPVRRGGRQGPGYPSTRACTGWWRDFNGSTPWAGTASAGTSGSKSITGVLGTPANGSTQNSRKSVYMTTTASALTSSVLLTDLMSPTAYVFWMVFRITNLSQSGFIMGSSDLGAVWDVEQQQSGSNREIRITHGTENPAPGDGGDVADTNPHILIVSWNNSSKSCSLDGTNTGGSSTAIGTMTSKVLQIGKLGGTSNASTTVELYEFGWIADAFGGESDLATFRTNMRDYARSWYAFDA